MMLRRLINTYRWFRAAPTRPVETWVDPTGVTLRPLRSQDARACRFGNECDECGCPGYTCVDPTTCCRSHEFKETAIAAR